MKGQSTSSFDFQDATLEETREYLANMFHRHGSKSLQAFLVEHVLQITEHTDWPTRRAAAEAIIRRLSFVKRDSLKILTSPSQKKLLPGEYKIGVAKNRVRPYRTIIQSCSPYRGSCDCPDFLKNSLGLCKHLLTILRDNILFESTPTPKDFPNLPEGHLWWDPVRPYKGKGDVLGQIRMSPLSSSNRKVTVSAWNARKWFISSHDGSLKLKELFHDDPKRRSAMIQEIQRVLSVKNKGELLDSALVSILQTEDAKLQQRIQAEKGISSLASHIKSIKRKLYPYQLEGLKRIVQHERFILADDMGLGKTAQAIASCHVLWKLGTIRKGLIVVPASLKSQWEKEWHGFTDVGIRIVDGSSNERKALYQNEKEGFFIINYEQLLRDLNFITAWSPDIVVLDEAQRIKNWETKTSIAVKSLTPRYRLVLTGTPMENRLDELASIFDWVDDRALEPKWRLTPWHSIFSDGIKEVAGVRNLETLRIRLADSMLRRVREDVLKQLPKRTDTVVPVRMTDEQIASHEELSLPIARLISMGKKRPLLRSQFQQLMSLLLQQRLISNGLELFQYAELTDMFAEHTDPSENFLHRLHSPKLLELRSIIKEMVIEQGRKVVVFSQWTRMLDLAQWAVKGMLQREGVRSAFFTGREKLPRRTQNVIDFHDDPSLRVLFLSDAGGVGLNLQRAANCCINIELPWNPAVLEQRIGRIYRLGQTKPIDVYNLVSEYGIESRIAGLVTNKKAFFKGLFEGKSDEVHFTASGNFIARLEKLVEPIAVPASSESSDEIDGKALSVDETPSWKDVDNNIREEGSLESIVQPTQSTELSTILSSISVTTNSEGAMTIIAPPEAAQTLAGIFDAFAGMLRRSVISK